MRRYLTTLLAAAALWAWPVTLCVTSYPLLVGCKSTKTTAYKTLAATETTVDASLKAFANARVHGKVDDPTFSKVQKLYSQYQVAFSAAVRTAQLDPNALTPADVASLAANLTATIEAILH